MDVGHAAERALAAGVDGFRERGCELKKIAQTELGSFLIYKNDVLHRPWSVVYVFCRLSCGESEEVTCRFSTKTWKFVDITTTALGDWVEARRAMCDVRCATCKARQD